MPQCKHCGKVVDLPFKCDFCGKYYCLEHRPPENHDCLMFSSRTPLEEKIYEKTIEKERITSEVKVKLKYIAPIFCILVILAAYTSYSFGYNTGYNASFHTAYDLGYAQGYINGNLTGFELGYRSGNSSGYIEGYNKGYLDGVIDGAGRGYNIRDPTYQEMLAFIALDKTDENEYSENYTCFHFTADVKSHAFERGYRCGFVYIRFPDSAHAIVCFNTTDRGLIFIEPQSDDIVTLAIGQPYWDRTKYLPPEYNDTVVSFTIIW